MNNNRLNKQCALLIKSRVALYEATFEKYHQGTGRVRVTKHGGKERTSEFLT